MLNDSSSSINSSWSKHRTFLNSSKNVCKPQNLFVAPSLNKLDNEYAIAYLGKDIQPF